MIEKIEFSVEGQKKYNLYNREEYLLYLEKKRICWNSSSSNLDIRWQKNNSKF